MRTSPIVQEVAEAIVKWSSGRISTEQAEEAARRYLLDEMDVGILSNALDEVYLNKKIKSLDLSPSIHYRPLGS
jgi:hypothetical protein